MKLQIEEIHWNDHETGIGWKQIKETKDTPAKVISCGMVIKENKQTVVLGVSVDNETFDVMGTIIILKSCITKRKKHGQI